MIHHHQHRHHPGKERFFARQSQNLHKCPAFDDLVAREKRNISAGSLSVAPIVSVDSQIGNMCEQRVLGPPVVVVVAGGAGATTFKRCDVGQLCL